MSETMVITETDVYENMLTGMTNEVRRKYNLEEPYEIPEDTVDSGSHNHTTYYEMSEDANEEEQIRLFWEVIEEAYDLVSDGQRIYDFKVLNCEAVVDEQGNLIFENGKIKMYLETLITYIPWGGDYGRE